MSTVVTKLVFRRRDDVRWAPVFALRPELDRIEVDLWETSEGTEGDLTVFYQGSDTPFPIRSFRTCEFKDFLYECWAEVSPELFTE